MAKYKSLVSTLFIYNKICENVKKLENLEISSYLGEKFFSRVKNFWRGGGGLRTLQLRFLEGGVKTPTAHPRAHVCKLLLKLGSL